MTDVWLRHVGLPGEEGHGGAFLCPEGAVADWWAMGWEPGEAPEEPNPVVAENIAAQQAAAEEQARLDEEAKPKSKSKTWQKNEEADTTPEGN